MLDPFMPCPMHGSKSFTPSSKILVLNLVAGCQEKTAARCGPPFFRPAIPVGERSHQIRHHSKKPLAPESWFSFCNWEIYQAILSESWTEQLFCLTVRMRRFWLAAERSRVTHVRQAPQTLTPPRSRSSFRSSVSQGRLRKCRAHRST